MREGEIQEDFLEKGPHETKLKGLISKISAAWVPKNNLQKHRLIPEELPED